MLSSYRIFHFNKRLFTRSYKKNLVRSFAIFLACQSSSAISESRQLNSSEAVELLNTAKHVAESVSITGTVVIENLGISKKVKSLIQTTTQDGKVVKQVESMNDGHVVEVHVGDKLTQYLPENKLIKVSSTAKPSFPSLFYGDTSKILENYEVVTKKNDKSKNRVAGFETIAIELIPRDDFRWGIRAWLEQDSLLLLKVEYFNHNRFVIKKDYFVDVSINPVEEIRIKNQFPESHTWNKLLVSKFNNGESKIFKYEPVKGFKLIKCFDTRFNRIKYNKKIDYEKSHCLFSDGVAAVSMLALADQESDVVFAKKVLTRGCLSLKSGLISNRSVSSVGCVPRETVQSFFNNSMID
ncbi:MAG: hypothetical protein CBC42_00650 [Betaproteobacteria bacterium TMED82]|nr:MAG: hypothetical protein CBC42_00650 [Betaproteobacteria bacterium TMED82]|tara:strand:+ start:17152 stop:18210 length:1059 start_codon:yes stop_codon:yes gene_type:complete